MTQNSVKVLYGSQNFGYANETSDKDYMEFLFPTWKDILNPNFTCSESYQEDGSILKQKDARLLLPMLKKSNINDLQVLFSKEITNKEKLAWFFDNRYELVRMNLPGCYYRNRGYIKAMVQQGTPVTLSRAFATLLFLTDLAENNPPQFCYPITQVFRKYLENNVDNPQVVQYCGFAILHGTDTLEDYFSKTVPNEKLLKEVEKQMLISIKKYLTD